MDEAFERARSAYGTGAYDDATLEFLFPQLKESEEEKIINQIISLIKEVQEDEDWHVGKWSDDAIEWLEKQKEQKPDISDEAIREGVSHFGITQYQINNWLKKHINVIEQKPAEWSEKHVADIFEKVGLAKIAREQGNDELTNALQDAMLELSKMRNTEWSEEDEKLFWGFTAWVPNEELERLGVTRDDILKKLKSLRLQPIQLKEAYKDGFQTARHAMALAFMNYLDENRPKGKMSLSNGECEDIDKAFKEGDWAKIMRYYEKYRPSWRPSEEHLSALLAVFNDPNNIGSQTCQLALTDLYEQLKKMI